MKDFKRVLRFHVSIYPQKKGGYWVYIGNILKKVSRKLREQLVEHGKVPARVGIHHDPGFDSSIIIMFSERGVVWDDDSTLADPTGVFSGRGQITAWLKDSSLRCPSDKSGRIYITNKITANGLLPHKKILKPNKKVATLYSNGSEFLLTIPVLKG